MTLLELLQTRSVPHLDGSGHHHAGAGWIQCNCPWCQGGRWRLGLHKRRFRASCWVCGPHRLDETLALLTGMSPGQVRAALDRPEPGPAEVEQVRAAGILTRPGGVGPLLREHRAYLRGRGFDPDEVQKLWGVRGLGPLAELPWRLYLPVFSGGREVSWTTRAIGETATRYLSARPEQEVVRHKSVLYGEDLAWHSVLVFEGPTNCWRVGPGGVATMGTGYTRAQLVRLARYPVRHVCFDSEPPQAQDRARQLCDALAAFPGWTANVVLESAKDAAAASDREVRQLLRLLEG